MAGDNCEYCDCGARARARKRLEAWKEWGRDAVGLLVKAEQFVLNRRRRKDLELEAKIDKFMTTPSPDGKH